MGYKTSQDHATLVNKKSSVRSTTSLLFIHRLTASHRKRQEKRISLRLNLIVMHCKISSGTLAILLIGCLILLLAGSTEAQLNFSTGWGKRNKNFPIENESDTGCSVTQGKPTLEILLNLHNLIRIEAKRIINCEKMNQ